MSAMGQAVLCPWRTYPSPGHHISARRVGFHGILIVVLPTGIKLWQVSQHGMGLLAAYLLKLWVASAFIWEKLSF